MRRMIGLLLPTIWFLSACEPPAVQPDAGPSPDGKPARAAALAMAPPNDPPASRVSLQQLIDQATDDSNLKIPRATYLSDTSVIVRNRKNLVLEFEPGATVLVQDVDYAVLQIEGSVNIAVRNARMRHVRHLTRYNCHGPVVMVAKSRNIYIDNCELNGCGAVGVSAHEVEDLTVQHCWIHHNTFNAFYFDSCSRVKVLANLVENNANFLQLHDCDFVQLSDNYVRRNGGYWGPADLEPGMKQPPVEPTRTPPTKPAPTTRPAKAPTTPPAPRPIRPAPTTQPATWAPRPAPVESHKTEPPHPAGDSIEDMLDHFSRPSERVPTTRPAGTPPPNP